MAKLKYLWIVESRAGLWNHWISTGKRGPMPDADGFMLLDKKKYATDPRKFRRWTFRTRKIFGKGSRIKRTYQVQLWKENDPTPTEFLHVRTPDPRFTSEMIATMSKSKRLNKIIAGESFDILKLILLLSVIGNLVIVGWLLSQVIH